MTELRWILLGLGVALIVVVYFVSRPRRDEPADSSTTIVGERREPTLGESPPAREEAIPVAPELPLDEPDPMPGPPPAEAGPARPADAPAPVPGETRDGRDNGDAGRDRLIVLHVAARVGERFPGPDLAGALRAEGLVFGDFDIFHRRAGEGGASGQTVFSVASMVEPGTFDLDRLESFSTPGLSLFMMLPSPVNAIDAFGDMLATGRRLAAVLGGELQDESGSTLSQQAAGHLRDQVVEFTHRVRR